MNIRISILTVLFGLCSLGAAAQTAQSDYEIQKSFKQQYSDFQQKLDVVNSPDSMQVLIDSIKKFDRQYENHAELLNKALYPETYSQRMENLKKSSVVVLNRLQTIQKQTQRLDTLQKQLAGYENNLQDLNRRTDSLQKEMRESIQSEKQLSSMVRQYRESLEKRDELILAFIDSMVVAYQQMDLRSLQDLENIDKKSRIESDGDALKMIRDISAENLNILEQNSEKLRLQDYMRMAEVQDQFEKMWTRLGTKIKEVYEGENAEELARQVDKNIGAWGEKLKSQTFAALKDTLGENNIELSEFKSSEEFFTSLETYLDSKIEKSREGGSDTLYTDFQNFQKFWNQVEVRWSSNFVDAGIVSSDQMATLNRKVDTWGQQVQPGSSNLLVYLLGGSVLLLVALGVLLFREKKGKKG